MFCTQAVLLNCLYKTNLTEVRDLSEANIMGLCTIVQSKKWAEVFSECDVDTEWECYYTIFNHYFSTGCPLVRKQFTGTPNNQ
jgi:hypothetical protein